MIILVYKYQVIMFNLNYLYNQYKYYNLISNYFIYLILNYIYIF